MTSIEETLKFFTNNQFNIQHPYADFSFRTDVPVICGGTLCISVWELKGKISFDGNTWYDIEGLNPKDDKFTEFFYDSMFNNYGWVYQDIHATFNEEIKKSVFKNFKIISLSNKLIPNKPIFECRELSQMDRKILLKLDTAKIELSKEFNVKGISLTEEQIIVINLIDDTLPETDLLVDDIDIRFKPQLFDIEEKITYILKGIGITRFTIGKIHKHD
jgi:hypothetical protein